jgi:hypothetical protein
VGGARQGLGVVAVRRGRLHEALAEFDAGIAEYHRLHDRVREGELRLHRAAVLRGFGREDEAERELAVADELIGDAAIDRVPPLEKRLRRWFPPIVRA